MTFNIKTLGCKVNTYESELIYSLFIKKGYSYMEKNADVYVINTCTVTNMSDRKSRQTINKVRKENPNAIIIVCGCFVENAKAKNNLDEVDADIFLGNMNKSHIIDYLEDYCKNKKTIKSFGNIKNAPFEDMKIEEYHNRTRAFVKIEDGCNNFCTYCIIPYVRGNVRSKKKETALKEIEELVKNGYKEIVLTGIHTGAYKDGDCDFASLLEEIIKIPNLERLRISSVEINELNDRVLEIFKNSNILVPHLHIPLQSGSEFILKQMNRKYDKKFYKDKIEKIRKIKENVSITTDVIVGFPGETEKEHKESLDFIKEIGFTKVHVFPYSDRYGTVASKMENKINGTEKKKRVNELIELSNKLENDFYKKFYGKTLKVLFEKEIDGNFYGHTDNYIMVKTKGNYKVHEIYDITLTKENIITNNE